MGSQGLLALALAFAVGACGDTRAAPARALGPSIKSARRAGAPPVRVTVPLVDSSWSADIHFAITSPNRVADGGYCPSSSFSVRFWVRGSVIEMLVGNLDYLFESDLISTRLGAYTLADGYSLSFAPVSGRCANISLRELTLRAFDDDGDGIADLIEGRGNAQASLIREDTYDDLKLAFRFIGVPNTAPRRAEFER